MINCLAASFGRKCACLATSSGDTAAEAARQAVQRKERGLTAIRFRAFHSYDAQDFHEHKLAVRQQIKYLEAIRKAVGDDVDLILECHGRYDPEWAIERSPCNC